MRDATALFRGLLIWLVPFAIVVVALGYETDWGRAVAPETPRPAAPAAQPVAVALLPEYRVEGGLDARRETIDRVLFNPTRRPAPPANQTAAAPSSMKKGLFTLTGTTVVGNTATAFLREVNGGKSRSVRKGETIDGMVVAEVASDHVRLKQGDEVEELRLKIATGPRTTVQTVVAAQPGAVPGQPAQPGLPVVRPGPFGGAATAGGSAPATGQPQTLPVAPPAVAAPPATATPRPTGTMSVSELLAERRRAARAAAEAAAGRAATPSTPR
jgi:hypothetical protein